MSRKLRASFSSVVVVPTTPTPMIVKHDEKDQCRQQRGTALCLGRRVENEGLGCVFMALTCRPGSCAAK